MKNLFFKTKKIIFILFSLVFLFASCKHEDLKSTSQNDPSRDAVSSADAMNIGGIVANGLFKNKNIKLKSTNAKEAIDEMYTVGQDTSMYVVNYKENNGFVVISGDKSTMPVIMYSERGKLNPDNVSDACVAWIAQSKLYIKNNIINLSSQKKAQIKKVWRDLMDGQTYMLPSENLTRTKSAQTATLPTPGHPIYGVSSLTTTVWDQGCYYNDNCPAASDGPCGLAYTGCVATAMAQIMAYWKYPSTYDWSQMPDTYGTSEIARLMSNIGSAVNMSYGGLSAGGSSAEGSSIAPALINTFGYSTSATYSGYDYSMVTSNLSNHWPVIMTGFASSYNYYTGIWPFRNVHTVYSDGHCWVCSGYLAWIAMVNGAQTEFDYLWMNWGWGASGGNGWCLNTGQNFQGNNNYIFQYNLNTVYNIHP